MTSDIVPLILVYLILGGLFHLRLAAYLWHIKDAVRWAYNPSQGSDGNGFTRRRFNQ